MTGAPWSVKGIDPKTREIAKDLARRSGMTLGEWLTHVIAEDGGEGLVAATSRKGGDRPASENRPPRRGGDDLERVLEALQDLSARFEASVEEQAETAARFDRAIAELKADQTEVAGRLQAAEQGGAGGGKVETLRALEGALNKVAGHLAAGEGRQREAMVELRRELGEEMSRVADQVNRKVLEVENRGADAIAQVGAEVTRVANAVEQRLRRADDAQAEALEKLGGEIARITERLSDRIAAAERRSTESVEEVGHQVARMTERLHERQERGESELVERMRQSEERTARLLEEAREAIDRRLLRAEPETATIPIAFDWTPHAPAAEAEPEEPAPALGAEGEDPATLVHAEAVDDEDFSAESILEAAYDGLAAKAGEASAAEPHAESVAEAPPRRPLGYGAFAPSLATGAVFNRSHAPALQHSGEDLEAMQAVADAITAEPHEAEETHAEPLQAGGLPIERWGFEEPHAAHQVTEPEPTGHMLYPDPLAETRSFGALSSEVLHFEALHAEEEPEAETQEAGAHEPEAFEPEAFEAEVFGAEPAHPSTREAIIQAKAAAFAEPKTFAPEDDHDGPDAIPTDAGAAFAGAQRPHRPISPMRGAITAGVAAGFMGLAGAGYVILHPEIVHSPHAPAAKPIPVGPASPPAAAPAPAPAPAPPQQAAVALATAPTPKPSAGPDLDSLYRDAAAKVDNGDATGVASLRTAANLGYAPAQRRLGKLLEDGGAGVVKDPAEGRRWTLRAASNGDVRAMHNLALDFYQGVGGPQNPTVAAQYFQRAAELGLRDSQYNLARFMEAGIGVQQDLPGAYRWYLIAARAGDAEAQTRAASLKGKLTADQQSRAQAMASAFQPDSGAAAASLTVLLQGSTPNQLTLAQRALGKLGYYKGPSDGAASQALGEAIQSYQRERGLAANGQLSPELLQTFAHVVQ